MDELVRDDPRWNVIELSSNHMAPVADPDLVAEALLEVNMVALRSNIFVFSSLTPQFV